MEDPTYRAHELDLRAQELLLMSYGLTHFDPETHLPIARLKPDDPDIREKCNALRLIMHLAARECFGHVSHDIHYEQLHSSGRNSYERGCAEIQT